MAKAIVPKPIETVRVAGYETAAATRTEIAEWMAERCLYGRNVNEIPAMLFSSNGQGIALQGSNEDYDAAMAAADIVHADGMPVVLCSRLLTSKPIPERSSTTDLFHDVAKVAEQDALRFFILGSNEDQNSRVVNVMRSLYPKLQIVGRHHGYFPDDEDDRICDLIRESGTDILWVALGKPRQEIWSHRNREKLAGVGCIKTCGGLYSYLVGDAPRAPHWMQSLGLEWLFRLMLEPRRLFVRYLTTNIISAWRLLRYTG